MGYMIFPPLPYAFFALYRARGIFSHLWWCRWPAKAWILNFAFLKQQFKASLEQFYIFNYTAEGNHDWTDYYVYCFDYEPENTYPESEETFQLSINLSSIPHANQGTNSSRGSGGQNTVIRMQLSIRASTSFRFVCSLKQNAGKGILRWVKANLSL